MDHQKFVNLIRGKFDNIPKNKLNQVRIFLSSTFSGKNFNYFYHFYQIFKFFTIELKDTHAERGKFYLSKKTR